MARACRLKSGDSSKSGLRHLKQSTVTVSYTHLDVYKRQALSDMLDGGAFSCLAVLGKGSQLGQIVTIQVCSADGRWLKCGVKEEIV